MSERSRMPSPPRSFQYRLRWPERTSTGTVWQSHRFDNEELARAYLARLLRERPGLDPRTRPILERREVRISAWVRMDIGGVQ